MQAGRGGRMRDKAPANLGGQCKQGLALLGKLALVILAHRFGPSKNTVGRGTRATQLHAALEREVEFDRRRHG